MQIFGFIDNTRSTSDKIINRWGIPAQTKGLARRQAKINARIKHGQSAEVLNVDEGGEGSLPGQTIYFVETRVDR